MALPLSARRLLTFRGRRLKAPLHAGEHSRATILHVCERRTLLLEEEEEVTLSLRAAASQQEVDLKTEATLQGRLVCATTHAVFKLQLHPAAEG